MQHNWFKSPGHKNNSEFIHKISIQGDQIDNDFSSCNWHRLEDSSQPINDKQILLTILQLLTIKINYQ